jgi:hypothetical protein
MLHGILGFLPFVLDLAGIFLGLALTKEFESSSTLIL